MAEINNFASELRGSGRGESDTNDEAFDRYLISPLARINFDLHVRRRLKLDLNIDARISALYCFISIDVYFIFYVY